MVYHIGNEIQRHIIKAKFKNVIQNPRITITLQNFEDESLLFSFVTN